jgi:hypothetical protein
LCYSGGIVGFLSPNLDFQRNSGIGERTPTLLRGKEEKGKTVAGATVPARGASKKKNHKPVLAGYCIVISSKRVTH